jgi:hypothetical protein
MCEGALRESKERFILSQDDSLVTPNPQPLRA